MPDPAADVRSMTGEAVIGELIATSITTVVNREMTSRQLDP